MKIKKLETSPPLLLGWREWVALPELGLPGIKAKLDTGARTSSLHTFDLKVYEEEGRTLVRFRIHPLQNREDIEIECCAEVIDKRKVMDSGGHLEDRWVIRTPIQMGNRSWPIEITLTNRDSMRFRMLLGRTAMHGGIAVNPSHSYSLGRSLKKAYGVINRGVSS